MERITSEELEHIVARYDGGISHVDHKIGQLFKLLKENNLYDNSLIILTSDHGETLGDRESNGTPQLDGHGGLYDIGLHVPLIIKFPKGFDYNGPVTGKRDDLVRTIDIFPTVLDTLSFEIPSYIEGESLLRVTGRRTVFASLAECYSYRTADSKVLVNSPALGGGIEIYDLQKDPSERVNLYEERAEESSARFQFAKEMLKSKESLGKILRGESQEVQELDPETVKGLKALGYLD